MSTIHICTGEFNKNLKGQGSTEHFFTFSNHVNIYTDSFSKKEVESCVNTIKEQYLSYLKRVVSKNNLNEDGVNIKDLNIHMSYNLDKPSKSFNIFRRRYGGFRISTNILLNLETVDTVNCVKLKNYKLIECLSTNSPCATRSLFLVDNIMDTFIQFANNNYFLREHCYVR